MVVKLNTVRLNGASLNHASLNGVGERLRASAGGGGGEVIPPEEPDVPDVPVTYILSASASNGVVSASVNGKAVTLPYTANEGDVVVVEVTANDGYEFEGWSDGSTDNPRSITMTTDVTLSATCVEQVVESKYIEFADPAVEAICVANWSSDGIGLTKEDAAAVTSIAGKFNGNTEIVSFDELEYFTGLTVIGDSSFYNCSNMKSLRLPKNITQVKPYAFYNCTAAFEIDLPNLTMASSGNGREFTPSGVVAVKNMGSIPKVPSFASCKSLRYAIHPVTATDVSSSAFYQCTALEALVFENPTPATIGDNYAFTGTSCNVYVPDASVADYQAATRWTSISSRIKGISSLATDNPTLYEEIKDYLS